MASTTVPTAPIRKTIRHTIIAMMKKTGLSVFNSALSILCNMIKRASPAAEPPVNSKNILSIPLTFVFTVRTSNVTPRPMRTTPPERRTILSIGGLLTGRMKIIPTTMTKTPTNAQNIDQINFPFNSAHLPFYLLALHYGLSTSPPVSPFPFKARGKEVF